MKHLLNLKSILVAAAAMLATAGVGQAATDWPQRPVTLIVPYAAGGGTDATGRIIAKMLKDEYEVPFKVVNRPGGGGVIGHKAIADAKPDGYTIGVGTFSLSTFKTLGSSQISPADFTPIALYNIDPTVVLVQKGSEWQSLMDMLDAIKSEPEGTFALATPIGAGHHLAIEQLLTDAGIAPQKVTTVPVTGGAAILQQLSAGAVDIGPSTFPEAASLLSADRLKALAVLSDQRSQAYPDVPTAEEAVGIDVQGGTWRGIVAPKGVDKAIVDTLSASIKRIYQSDEFREQMKKLGYGLRYMNSDDFGKFMAQQEKQNAKVLKALGLAAK